ncbi:MAG: ornithine cyclodeaminase [Paracoccaceae bacterium]|nr:ornithine cyclodeaminase [Paracoccaceae bacterium]
MTFQIIDSSAEPRLDWIDLTDALAAGHRLPEAQLEDVVMHRAPDTMLSRHAWIDGLGIAVKTCQIFPENHARHGLPSINGVVTLFSDTTGLLEAVIDFHLVTKWKTAGDSLLAARRLARPDSRDILIIGAGTVARSLVEAYSALFPDARFAIWNRTMEKVDAIITEYPDRQIARADDLASAATSADIICTCTMTKSPILRGSWLRPGQHIDLIGAYLPDMRETDDDALGRARIFADSRKTALETGELMIPIETGIITERDIIADYRELETGRFARQNDDEITLFKNGGGAHLDLMTSDYIRRATS